MKKSMSWFEESMLVVFVWLVVAGLLDEDSRPEVLRGWEVFRPEAAVGATEVEADLQTQKVRKIRLRSGKKKQM